MTRYRVRLQGDAEQGDGFVLQPGLNLYTGEAELEEFFDDLTTLERDLALIASAIFASDRGTVRGEREGFLERTIQLSIPVVNAGRLQPVVRDIERILRVLSDDSWEIELRQVAGIPEAKTDWVSERGATLLFSGGLDSFCGAVELMKGGVAANLVSHVTKNRKTKEAQASLVTSLMNAGLSAVHFPIFVSSGSTGVEGFDHDIEPSQRTRSFVFLVFGAIVARRTGFRDILMMAENGQFAIHLPLSDARIGAFSTHTAHPEVLARMEAFLSDVLDVELNIENPFIYETKAEVTQRAVSTLPDLVPVTTSCWMNARVASELSHCGECVPCLMRRVAIEFHGADGTGYQRDVLGERIARLDRDDAGRRNVVELAEFAVRVRAASNEDLLSAFPELISRFFDRNRAMEMYRRFANEALQVLSSRPGVAEVL